MPCHEVVEPAKGGWLFYIARCACGFKVRRWNHVSADQAIRVHVTAEEADK